MMRSPPRWVQHVALGAGYGAGHVLLLLPANVFWHPPAGWRFAFLSMLPIRLWVWPLASELVVFLLLGNSMERTGGSIGFAVLAFAAHRGLAATGPWVLHRSHDIAFEDAPGDMRRLIGAMLLSAAAATVFTAWWLPPLLTGAEGAMARPLLIMQLLLGDFVGMLLIVPATLMLARYRPDRGVMLRWGRDIPFVLTPALSIYVAVTTWSPQQAYFFTSALCLLPVVFFAFRTGWRGVSVALPIASAAVAIFGAPGDVGAPAQAQLLLSIGGSACLFLGAANDALRASQARLSGQNEHLQASNRKLDAALSEIRLAARRNLELSEQTRRWITSELHDELGQNLTALHTRLRLAERGTRHAELFTPAWAIIQEMRRSVSRLTASLRPAGLDDLGLLRSLEQGAIREFVESSGLVFDLRIEDPEDLLELLSDNVQTALYRMTQEAATNTVRHASSATTFSVHLRARSKRGRPRVLLSVGDDGSVLIGRFHEGVGLQGIRDRVLSLNGRLRRSIGPRGTWLRVVLEAP